MATFQVSEGLDRNWAVSPDGRPGGLGQLIFDSRGVPVTGAALSPGRQDARAVPGA